MPAQIKKSTLKFLKDLVKNNNREWFAEHKHEYIQANENVKSVMAELYEKLNKHDVLESHKTFRIYRDVRFSKNKTPYKSNIGTGFTRATEARRGGFYINIEPGNTFVGGGFWSPNSQDLKRIRKELELNATPLRKIMKSKKFNDLFNGLQGDQLKTAPKGYDKEHPNIDLLRYKQFLVHRTFTDAEATSPSFIDECNTTYKGLKPFFDFMSLTLTTNENGESIL